MKCVDKGIDTAFSAINKVLFKATNSGKDHEKEEKSKDEAQSESKLVLTPELLEMI